MKQIVLLVGPPGSGKSTLAKNLELEGFVRVSQDDQGKDGHMELFDISVLEGKSIVVDRMNFNKIQRERYLHPAKLNGYKTKIVIKHENFVTCFERAIERKGHPTIKDDKGARSALNLFFSKYERVEDSEADEVQRLFPEGHKPQAVICDLDGTLCDIDHRLHFVKGPAKKDWKSFSESCVTDKVHDWCYQLVVAMKSSGTKVAFASGRSDEYYPHTKEWLEAHYLSNPEIYMRNRSDYRQDCIVKENILDFEILTRYTPLFFIDDRQQVVDMWRKRGFVCLQCAKGDF